MRRTAGSVYHNAYASTLGFNPVPDAAVRLEGTHLQRGKQIGGQGKQAGCLDLDRKHGQRDERQRNDR